MKTILRIILILLVASLVAGAFTLAVNNNWIASGSGEGGQPPALTGSEGQSTTQSVVRPEGGDQEEASVTRGLSGVLATLVKLTGITIVVLVLQKAVSLLGRQKSISIQH